MRFTFYIIVIFGILINYVHARPVSYPGGWTVMLKNDGNVNRIHTHFSPTHKFSLGFNGEYWHDEEFILNTFQINNLIKRWNKRNSQANFYIKSGFGFAYSDKAELDGEVKISGFSGISFDWENRVIFSSIKIVIQKQEIFIMHSASQLLLALLPTKVILVIYILG